MHAGVNYKFTTQQVVDLVNKALDPNDPQTIEDAKNQLAAANEAGCSIDQQGRVRSAGDVDANGTVDTRDLTVMVINFTGAGAALDAIDLEESDLPDGNFSRGDFDRDGDVDTADLTRAVINFTGAAVAPAAVDRIFDQLSTPDDMSDDFNGDLGDDLLDASLNKDLAKVGRKSAGAFLA